MRILISAPRSLVEREEEVRGKEQGASGGRELVRGGDGGAAVHQDARSDERSVEGGVHV